jgi:hypothetical protein
MNGCVRVCKFEGQRMVEVGGRLFIYSLKIKVNPGRTLRANYIWTGFDIWLLLLEIWFFVYIEVQYIFHYQL